MNSFCFLLNSLLDDPKLYEGRFSLKISFVISEAIPFLTLQIFVTSTWKFMWCTVTEFSRSRSSEKLKFFKLKMFKAQN